MLGTPVPSQDSSRWLNCLIEGESIVFVVTMGRDCVVSDLEEVIKNERALEDIGPHTLELWKPKDSSPIPAKPPDTLIERTIKPLGDDPSIFADRLDPTDSLFSIFSEKPPREYIHIIAKVLATTSRKHLLREEDDQEAKRQRLVPSQNSSRLLSTEMINLFCWVHGDDPYHIFPVEIAATKTVRALKATIKDKMRPAFNHIPADTLALWKVSINFDLNLQRNIDKVELDDGGQLLPWLKLSTVFSDRPTDDRLDIVIGSPPAPSQKHLIWEEDDQEAKRKKLDPDLAWLVEIHSKIWDRGEELLKTLVHKAEVTVVHFHELQRRLQNPDSNEDIPTIKREILLHYEPNHIAPDDVSEESGDDDLEFNLANASEESGDDVNSGSFLPATFEFLDLSSLKLENTPPRLPLPLLVRSEYSFILNKIQGTQYSHMISGQPGTGKTAFLHYMVIKYMLDGIPFIYQSIHGIVYHVSQKVEIIESWNSSKHIVGFVDTDSEKDTPKSFLNRRSIQFILASSLKGSSPYWVKQDNKAMFPWVTKLWTEREFFVTGIFLHPYPLDFARLRESSFYFGFNPRRCFEASKSQAICDAYRLSTITKIGFIDKNISLFDLLMGALTTKHHEMSHVVFEMFPFDENRHLPEAQARAVSPWVLDELLMEYNRRQANSALEFYKMIAGFYEGPIRGDMFQMRALKYFDTIKQPMTFRIRNLSTQDILDWCYPGPAPRRAFEKWDSAAVLKETVQQKQPRHLVPLAPNYAAFDSILYEPKSVLTGLQVTITKEHPIAVSGLETIQQLLKRNTLLADLWPCTLNWRLIFVVPQEDADSFEFQKFTGDTANSWAQKVDQYVLGLNVNEVFKN